MSVGQELVHWCRKALPGWEEPHIMLISSTGSISTADGSALVRMGDTTMVCGIKAEVAEPDMSRPQEGFIGVPTLPQRFRESPWETDGYSKITEHQLISCTLQCPISISPHSVPRATNPVLRPTRLKRCPTGCPISSSRPSSHLSFSPCLPDHSRLLLYPD